MRRYRSFRHGLTTARDVPGYFHLTALFVLTYSRPFTHKQVSYHLRFISTMLRRDWPPKH